MKTIRAIVALAATILAGAALAQSVTLNCTTVPCDLVTDPYPAGATQPTSCRLYSSGVQVVETPAAVVATSGLLYCLFPARTFVVGTHVLTARGVDVLGQPSAESNTLTLTSVLPPPPPPMAPTGLRVR